MDGRKPLPALKANTKHISFAGEITAMPRAAKKVTLRWR